MGTLRLCDIAVIATYYAILLGIGLYLRKRASTSIEAYFLGKHQLPWWALGVAGISSWVEIAGTMVLVSFIFMLGPKGGLFTAARAGSGVVLIIMTLWTGKWHRRTGCLTGAEWMKFRFGDGVGGQLARIASVVLTVAVTVGILAFMIKGIGLFVSMFLPVSPVVGAILLLSIAVLYSLLSGFYGIVVADMFQSFIMLFVIAGITVLAVIKVGQGNDLSTAASFVTGSGEWMSFSFSDFTSMPKGYENYNYLSLIILFCFLRSILQGMGCGQDPRFLASKNDRECGLVGFFWSNLQMITWPLAIGFAILGIYLVRDVFPDKSLLNNVVEVIKVHKGIIEPSMWPTVLAEIINHPETVSPALRDSLQNIMGDNWKSSLLLVNYDGSVNAERVLPAVILRVIPGWFRGLVLTALIGGSTSVFVSFVNATSGYLVKDIYQKYIHPLASNKELIFTSWMAGLLITLAGFAFAYSGKNANDLLSWVLMGLMSGTVIPAALRLYWWRFNGEGFAYGLVFGLAASIFQRIYFPEMPEHFQFVILLTVSLIASVVCTYMTRPTEQKVLEAFYKTTRPFGFWGPLKKNVSVAERSLMFREHIHDLCAFPFAVCWYFVFVIIIMQLMIRNWEWFWLNVTIFCVSLVGVYFFWYRQLPLSEDNVLSEKGDTIKMVESSNLPNNILKESQVGEKK